MVTTSAGIKALPKTETWSKKIHHYLLLLQYWWVRYDKEQFASYCGKRVIVKQTPHFLRRDWVVSLNGTTQAVDSDKIKRVYGSFELYNK
ncbi:MAG: hypothetical protein RLZZ230_850 [Candidatus Parcubacteria bacterium]|jgi:hypothetical protein